MRHAGLLRPLVVALMAGIGAVAPASAQMYPQDGEDDRPLPRRSRHGSPYAGDGYASRREIYLSQRDIEASYPADEYGDAAAAVPVDPSLREGGYGRSPGDSQLEQDSGQTTRAVVEYATAQPPGTIVIDTSRRRLFVVEGGGRAVSYGIGVGRAGFAWKGLARVGRKSEWPAWIPPAEMLRRRPELPERMEGGIDNPLGARALYLFQGNADTLFRIHGTNEPDSIGKAVSSGCIRMLNADVIDLYRRIPVGTKVVVL